MQQLLEALDSINLKILKYDLSKQRPVTTSRGTMNIEKFCDYLKKDVGPYATDFPDAWKLIHRPTEMEIALIDIAREKKILYGEQIVIEIPPEMKGLMLNHNLAAKSPDERFFLTHKNETVSQVSGDSYMLINQLSPVEAAAIARKVIPEYSPRGPLGVIARKKEETTENIFNIYTPPEWTKFRGPLPDKLPPLFERLVRHLFPLKIEQEYFYAWLHDSLFKRAFVFLILCGPPGNGKNRLKINLRALHGHVNTVDGKKSTLVERFNSQLSESTMAWFDELHYDVEMENVMKELQNDTISIERKGIDATRATRIYASIAISNNKPRDNYIAFDARKFVPLKLNSKRLEESMSPQEITELTDKVENESAPTFDIKFLAQIARWIKKHGESNKWPNLEYRGPMFWTLAHTSMTRWQKKAATLILEPEGRMERIGYDSKKGAFLWSTIQAKSIRKHGDKSLQFPDSTSVRAFFEIFRDGKGRKAFSTELVPGDNIMGDFWVKPLFKKMEIITEATVAEQRSRENERERKKVQYDL